MWVTVTSRYISQHTHVVLGSCDRAEALQMASLGGLSSSLTLQDSGNASGGQTWAGWKPKPAFPSFPGSDTVGET